MIRTIIIPSTTNYKVTLDFPIDYIGEEIEIIAFKKQEGLQEKTDLSKKFTSFDNIKIDTSDFNINREEANER